MDINKIKFFSLEKNICWNFFKDNIYIYITTKDNISINKVNDIKKSLEEHLLNKKGNLIIKYMNSTKEEYKII